MKNHNIASFDESLKTLNISDYKSKIMSSNSHGELLHCYDYIALAEQLSPEAINHFRDWFIKVIDYTNKHWSRPESVYQHILSIMEYNSYIQQH